MTDLQRYELVNNAHTINDLITCILGFADEDGMIQGRTQKFDAQKMALICQIYYEKDTVPISVVTRNWGLRYKLAYLKQYH